MIIWIDAAAADCCENTPAVIVDAILELGEAGYKGRHVVVGPRPLMAHLANFEALSLRARVYFRRIAEEYTQLGAAINGVRNVIASIGAFAPISYGGGWRVPLSLFAQSEYSEPCSVVCENDTDYEIYSAFAEFMARKNFPGFVLSSRSHAGGGASTSTVLSRLLARPGPVFLCILDSDRSAVLGAEGSTARGCRRVWTEGWRNELFVLNSRELENIVPWPLICRWAESVGMDDERISSFESVHSDVSSYVCLKSGEPLCRFHRVSADAEGYERTINALRETAKRHARFSRCGASCDECGCSVSPPLGENFLRRFSDWVRDHNSWRLIPDVERWPVDLTAAASLFLGFSLALPRKQ